MKYFKTTTIVISLFLSASFAASANANENPPTPEKNWDLAFSGLLIWTPKFIGSDEYEVIGGVSVDGYLSLSEQSTLFVNNSGVGLNYQLSDNFNAGILSNVRADQDRSSVKNVDGLSNVDLAYEVGPYLSYQLTNQLEISINGLFDISDKHDGWVANLGLSHEYTIPNTPVTMTTLVGLDYANKNYNDTYYGVKSSTTDNSSQPSFALDSGLNSTNIGTTFSYASSKNISLFGSISMIQIIGDPKDSPIIKKDRFITLGLGITYIL